MTRLGKPGTAHRLLGIASVVAYVLARQIAGPLMPAQFLIMLLVLEFVVQPVSTLIHELGHAAAARRVSTGLVSVTVGRGPFLSFAIDRVRVNFSFLPSRGVMIRGVCTSDVRGVSWRDRAVIALAGPAATSVELLVGIGIAAGLWAHAGLLARNLILLSLLGLACSVVVNLVPHKVGIIANDGAQAVAALQRHRRHEPVPTGAAPAGAQPAADGDAVTPADAVGGLSPEAAVSNAPSALAATYRATMVSAPAVASRSATAYAELSERERDLARARTSVPPPRCD